ncbi:MAG: hypothetical protein ACE5PT_10500 [Gemmatimonadales bacterium]
MRRLSLSGAVLGMLVPICLAAQELTVESIWGSRTYSSDLVSVRWMADGRAFTTIERTEDGASDLYRVDAQSGERELLVRGRDLIPQGDDRPIVTDPSS